MLYCVLNVYIADLKVTLLLSSSMLVCSKELFSCLDSNTN